MSGGGGGDGAHDDVGFGVDGDGGDSLRFHVGRDSEGTLPAFKNKVQLGKVGFWIRPSWCSLMAKKLIGEQ